MPALTMIISANFINCKLYHLRSIPFALRSDLLISGELATIPDFNMASSLFIKKVVTIQVDLRVRQMQQAERASLEWRR